MTTIEMIGLGSLLLLAMCGACSFLISYFWVWGDWMASDRINSIIERREEEKDRQAPVKVFNPKRND